MQSIYLSDKGLESRIYKELCKPNNKETTQLKSEQKMQTDSSPKKKKYKMANKEMERWSTSLATSEMQIKTTVRFTTHLLENG